METAALGIVIEPKADGAPHGKVRLGDRHHTLSSKLLKDGQVFATYLWEWIRTLGQERLLADLLRRNDPRLRPTCGRRTRRKNNPRYQPCNAQSRA